ncbi:hypothetical protein CEXT_31271, partial [Caerostris extrusa]
IQICDARKNHQRNSFHRKINFLESKRAHSCCPPTFSSSSKVMNRQRHRFGTVLREIRSFAGGAIALKQIVWYGQLAAGKAARELEENKNLLPIG